MIRPPIWTRSPRLPRSNPKHRKTHEPLLFDHPRDGDLGTAHEGRVLDFLVEGFLADQAESAGDLPFDVVGEAGKDLRMVAAPEAFHVLLDRALVGGHSNLR